MILTHLARHHPATEDNVPISPQQPEIRVLSVCMEISRLVRTPTFPHEKQRTGMIMTGEFRDNGNNPRDSLGWQKFDNQGLLAEKDEEFIIVNYYSEELILFWAIECQDIN